MSDQTAWRGPACPVCGKPWPVESIRNDCLTAHGPQEDQ